jgi:hypothetical protein
MHLNLSKNVMSFFDQGCRILIMSKEDLTGTVAGIRINRGADVCVPRTRGPEDQRIKEPVSIPPAVQSNDTLTQSLCERLCRGGQDAAEQGRRHRPKTSMVAQFIAQVFQFFNPSKTFFTGCTYLAA